MDDFKEISTKGISRRRVNAVLFGFGAAAVGAHAVEGWRRVNSIVGIPRVFEADPIPLDGKDPIDSLDEKLRYGESFVDEALDSCQYLLTKEISSSGKYPLHATCMGEGPILSRIIADAQQNMLSNETILGRNDEKGFTYVEIRSPAPAHKRGFVRRYFSRVKEAITQLRSTEKNTSPIGFAVTRVLDSQSLDPKSDVSEFLNQWQMGTASRRLGLEDPVQPETSNNPLIHQSLDTGDRWKCVEQVTVSIQSGINGIIGTYDRVLHFVQGEDVVQIHISSGSQEARDGEIQHVGHDVEVFIGGRMIHENANHFVGHLIGVMRSSGFRDGTTPFGKSTKRNLASDSQKAYPFA